MTVYIFQQGLYINIRNWFRQCTGLLFSPLQKKFSCVQILCLTMLCGSFVNKVYIWLALKAPSTAIFYEMCSRAKAIISWEEFVLHASTLPLFAIKYGIRWWFSQSVCFYTPTHTLWMLMKNLFVFLVYSKLTVACIVLCLMSALTDSPFNHMHCWTLSESQLLLIYPWHFL